MSTDIKLNKSQLSMIIQSGKFRGKTLGNLGGSIIRPDVPLPKDPLHKLATKVTLAAIDVKWCSGYHYCTTSFN